MIYTIINTFIKFDRQNNGKSHDNKVRGLVCLLFPIIWCQVLILRTDLIKNPCVQLLVKNFSVP